MTSHIEPCAPSASEYRRTRETVYNRRSNLTPRRYEDRAARHAVTERDRLRADKAELLEACYSILNIEGPAMVGTEAGAFTGLDTRYHFDKVRAAIAKAEGRP